MPHLPKRDGRDGMFTPKWSVSVLLPAVPRCPACGKVLNPALMRWIRGLAVCTQCATGVVDPPVCPQCHRYYGSVVARFGDTRIECATCHQVTGGDVSLPDTSASGLRLLMRAVADPRVRKHVYIRWGLWFWCPASTAISSTVYDALRESPDWSHDLSRDTPDTLSDSTDPPELGPVPYCR